MSKSPSRIARYQQRADESLAKARLAADETIRTHYMRVAETYLRLIQMELRRQEIRSSLSDSNDGT
jgi:hypothetical protein